MYNFFFKEVEAAIMHCIPYKEILHLYVMRGSLTPKTHLMVADRALPRRQQRTRRRGREKKAMMIGNDMGLQKPFLTSGLET